PFKSLMRYRDSPSGLRRRFLETCRLPSAAKNHAGAQQEPEVVPAAVVMHFVEVHLIRKQRNDERNRADEAVPQAKPEPRNPSTGPCAVREHIRTCRTTHQE